MSSATGDVGLLEPGRHRTHGITDDAAIVAAMLAVEVAWSRAQASVGIIDHGQADSVAQAVAHLEPDLVALAEAGEEIGNPVLAVVRLLRSTVTDPGAATLLHRGLTSQDVLDTALMVVAREALDHIRESLLISVAELTRLADTHRAAVMTGRTLTQGAVPITFGLKAAQWLHGILDALNGIARVRANLPVQVGGAAGTLSLAATMTDSPELLVTNVARDLDLCAPAAPWHTRRTPVTAVADALVTTTDALGVIAADVALLSRPEFGELAESADSGRGGSSTMPGKRNPVLSVLVRAAALQAPMLAASVHLAAGQMVDERPDGAWHAEWPPYRRLLRLAVTAASQAAELLAGLQVNTEVMASRAESLTAELLREHYGSAADVPADADPRDYLGITEAIIDSALSRAAGVAQAPRHRRGPDLTFTRLAGSAGRGDVVIVGAGLGTAAGTLWQTVADLLAEQFEVVGVDLPGHGASPAAGSDFTVADLAASVRETAAQWAASGRRVWYAGVSLAGAVALELALDPGPIAGVVAVASASTLGDPVMWGERAELVLQAGTSVMISGSVQRWFAPGFTDRQPEVVGRMLNDLTEVDNASYAMCCRSLAAYDVSESLPGARIPVLMAPGDRDTVVTVPRAEQDAARQPTGSVQVIGEAAHQPPVENPAQVATALTSFIASNGRAHT